MLNFLEVCFGYFCFPENDSESYWCNGVMLYPKKGCCGFKMCQCQHQIKYHIVTSHNLVNIFSLKLSLKVDNLDKTEEPVMISPSVKSYMSILNTEYWVKLNTVKHYVKYDHIHAQGSAVWLWFSKIWSCKCVIMSVNGLFLL